MSVIRVEKRQSNYVILDKSCLNDPQMRWRTKGLHAYLISLPDNWKINMTDLENRASDGREGLRGAMAELIKHGYVERKKLKDEQGKMQGYEYVVYEVPISQRVATQPELGITGETNSGGAVENEQSGPNVQARSNLFMRKYFAAWSRRTGGSLLPAKWLREGLRSLEDQHGEAAVYDAFNAFASSQDAKYGCKQFIQNFGMWSRKSAPKPIDAMGD